MKAPFVFPTLMVISLWSAGQGPLEKHITIDGLGRFYLLYSPPGLDASRKYPLVLVLHGGGGNARQMVGFSGFIPVASREKFLVVFPNGYQKSWHDGRVAPATKAYADNIDDVKFISSVIAEVSTLYPVDPKRIFSTGISNGAMMSLALAYHLSEKIRAIAPVCGSIAENLESEFKPAVPVSVLAINGTGDKLVPYAGGAVLREGADRGRVISTTKMMELWSSLLSKSAGPQVQPIPDSDPYDGCTAERLLYPSSDGTSIQLIRVNNGGHTWPGGNQYLPKIIIGRVCRDFKAEEVIWEFFKNQAPR